MKLIACYGSLKKGKYNHDGLGEGAEFMGDHSVRGVMYSNGSYPKLYHPMTGLDETLQEIEGEETRDHALEVYNISDEAYRNIESMEIGAGYVTEQIETPYGTAAIWYMPHEHFSNTDKWVESY